MNNRVLVRGLGMGALFVHKLTDSDISQNGMHIPKKIVSALNTRRKGWAILAMGDSEDHQEATSYTSTGGRIRFKSEWAKFVEGFDLEAGLIVLVMFHMDTKGFMNISFDFL